jgi:hypothetical protein
MRNPFDFLIQKRTPKEDSEFKVALDKMQQLLPFKFTEKDKDIATLEILIFICERLNKLEQKEQPNGTNQIR